MQTGIGSMVDAGLAEIAGRHRRSSRPIGALEGAVCAGKTTVAAELASDGVVVVPEYFDVPGAARRVGVDAPFAGDGLRRLSVLLELECARLTQMPPTGLVVLDRSVFSLLAYEAGLSAMTAPNVLADALEAVVAAVDGGAVALPERIIFLDCPASSCRGRAAAAGMRTPAFQFDPEFRGGFRQLFCRLERVAPGRVLFVDAARPLAEVVNQVRDLLTA